MVDKIKQKSPTVLLDFLFYSTNNDCVATRKIELTIFINGCEKKIKLKKTLEFIYKRTRILNTFE